MPRPPSPAPAGESSPPRIIAGNAANAMKLIDGESPAGPGASGMPASVARAGAAAHETPAPRRRGTEKQKNRHPARRWRPVTPQAAPPQPDPADLNRLDVPRVADRQV